MGWEFAKDLGFYAALLALSSAIISYQANRNRSVNQYYSVLCSLIALWQIVVMAARLTHNYNFWGPIASLFSLVLPCGIFLLHDAVVYPISTRKDRWRRNPLLIPVSITSWMASTMAYVASIFPAYSPVLVRGLFFIVFIATYTRCRRNQKTVEGGFKRDEMRLFYAVSGLFLMSLSIVLFYRTPLGSRIVSTAVMIVLGWANWLLLSDRVMDADGQGKLAFAHIGSAVLIALLNGLLVYLLFHYTTWPDYFPVAATSVLCILGSYPVWYFLFNYLRRRNFRTAITSRAQAMQETVKLLSNKHTEAELIAEGSLLIKNFIEANSVLMSELPESLAILPHLKQPVLSRSYALQRLKGAEQAMVLHALAAEHLSAVIEHEYMGHRLYLLIGDGMPEALSPDQIETIQGILSLTSAYIVKAHAVEASSRSSSMASVGRLAANFSHEARNQLAAITEVLDALRHGEEAEISIAHREAVYAQAIQLSASHNFALGVARLTKADGKNLKAVSILHETTAALNLCRSLLRNSKTELAFETDCSDSDAAMIEPVLYQRILFNLIQNSVQTFTVSDIKAPKITVAVRSLPTAFRVEVVDNGPGVPASIFDKLFVAYTTTKADGTGLGLSLCRDILLRWGGGLTYLTPKGEPNAYFQITVRRATEKERAAEAVSAKAAH